MTALNNTIDNRELDSSTQLGMINSISRSFLIKRLNRLIQGHVILNDRQEQLCFGEQNANLRVEVTIHNPRFYRRAVTGGGLGIAQSLIDGDWTCNDLTSLIRIFIRNLEVTDRFDGGLAWFRQMTARTGHWLRKNTRFGATRNIRAHYDLGNNFYRLFLDETMNYSSGVFKYPEDTMQDASIAKMTRACRNLNLLPDDHLVEIGTGWGGLAIYAAENYGCRVTTTTISREQYNLAVERVKNAGLTDQVSVLLCDYRDLQGKFDKLVSIEMIEAVGHHYFDTFFQKCSNLLRDDGLMLLQSIVIKDQRFKEYLRNVDFIRKYIFPGGCLPSVSAILESTSKVTDMRLLQLEDIAPHYAQTLRCWQQQFNNRLDQVRDLGYSESFIRMWNYYFSYCEAAFEERQCNTVQMLFAKPESRFDLVKHSFETTGFSRQEM
ncbi:SAM-dependent methyltransferase [Gimesia aquarii]|uniref:Cyclopropane-fatty-acyl-phospholipid synthase n=1 Tax=Gimesia aquarii TaxID=2527964 RepID=A0A517WWU4_9PLAN|nr:cyclopropane-fatty-acyl-phospholipid synthase family protein [Gimesia aquarii]QDU09714.1 Cyclopropane-fatty-acyl-phospholipid synthase [Gimesia aquarii]